MSNDSLRSNQNVFMQPRVLQFEAIETAGIKRKPAIEKDLTQTVSIIGPTLLRCAHMWMQVTY